MDLDEILEFRSRLPSNEHSRSYDGSQFSRDQNLSAKEQLENSSTILLSIEKLKEVDTCKRNVFEKDSTVFYSNCKSYVVCNTRYKIHVRGVDGTGCLILFLWNDIAHEMIGELASNVAETCVVEKYPRGDVEIITRDVRKLARPEPIQDLVGRTFLFKPPLSRSIFLGRTMCTMLRKFVMMNP